MHILLRFMEGAESEIFMALYPERTYSIVVEIKNWMAFANFCKVVIKYKKTNERTRQHDAWLRIVPAPLFRIRYPIEVYVLGVVKRNPLFLHEIEWTNNGFLFTIPNIYVYSR